MKPHFLKCIAHKETQTKREEIKNDDKDIWTTKKDSRRHRAATKRLSNGHEET